MKISPAPAFLVVLALRAAAAPAAVPPAAPPAPTGLPAPKAPYWLKPYSTAPLRESWSAVLTVKNLDADLPKVLKAISADGGVLTQDLKSFVSSKADHTQQLILTVPPKRAEALLKSWRRIGDLPAPAPNSTGERIPADEVRAKIDRLMKERVERAADLQKLPVALEIEDELLERLLMVEEVAKNQNGAVRIDLLVRQR